MVLAFLSVVSILIVAQIREKFPPLDLSGAVRLALRVHLGALALVLMLPAVDEPEQLRVLLLGLMLVIALLVVHTGTGAHLAAYSNYQTVDLHGQASSVLEKLLGIHRLEYLAILCVPGLQVRT